MLLPSEPFGPYVKSGVFPVHGVWCRWKMLSGCPAGQLGSPSMTISLSRHVWAQAAVCWAKALRISAGHTYAAVPRAGGHHDLRDRFGRICHQFSQVTVCQQSTAPLPLRHGKGRETRALGSKPSTSRSPRLMRKVLAATTTNPDFLVSMVTSWYSWLLASVARASQKFSPRLASSLTTYPSRIGGPSSRRLPAQWDPDPR